MSRFVHACLAVTLILLAGVSIQIPARMYGAPEWYSEFCWFANWKNPVWRVDCATNVPVASYYAGAPVLGMREGDREAFLARMREKGCLIAGVDYYANTAVSPFIFPKLFRVYNERMYQGAVVYIKICAKDSVFTYEVLGSSDENKPL